MNSGYREVPHTADIALEVWGRDLPELFAHAAEGMFSLAVSVEPGAGIAAEREIALSAYDWESLLVDWLNELLALSDERKEAYVQFDVRLPAPGQLSARVMATQAYTPRIAVKAATFHELKVACSGKGCRTVVVFDV